MILKFKYYHDSGMLTPYQSYTLAQNSHLSSKICITSTDTLSASYNYCLEFVCYNTKNVPKTQYISTVLQYGENGIEFDIPNNLTQFRGHTDIQLTGYDKTDNSVIFKSVAKNSKAFDVEGSLCVLENSISDTPNVITEILNQLAYLTDIKNNLVQEFLASANEEFGVVLSNYTWHTVNFWNRDTLIKTACYIKGYKVGAPPEYVLPANCVVEGGWYDTKTNAIWDFNVNVVTQDTDLSINYYTTGLTFQTSCVMDYNGQSTTVYIPRYYGGYAISNVSTIAMSVNHVFILYLNELISTVGMFGTTPFLLNMFVHNANKKVFMDKSCLVEKETLFMIKFCNISSTTYCCPSYCFNMKKHALHSARATRILLPSGLAMMPQLCIEHCDLIESLVIPESVYSIGIYAVANCAILKKVFLLPTIPPSITKNSFCSLNADMTWTNVDLYVRSDCLQKYKNAPNYSHYNIYAISDNDIVA